jgi:hypothetical protein
VFFFEIRRSRESVQNTQLVFQHMRTVSCINMKWLHQVYYKGIPLYFGV